MVLLVHFGVLLGPERGIAYNKILFGALLIYTVRFQFHCHCKFNCIIAEFFNGSYQSIFGSYQALLGACACKSCLLGVYSYRLSTFIFIVMADSASISFLTRRHARTHVRTHAHQENPLIEVGRAHLKRVLLPKDLVTLSLTSYKNNGNDVIDAICMSGCCIFI